MLSSRNITFALYAVIFLAILSSIGVGAQAESGKVPPTSGRYLWIINLLASIAMMVVVGMSMTA